MGLNSPNIRKVIHWKPPNDIEKYVQESRRSGHDGEPVVAVLYYGKWDESSAQLSGEMEVLHFKQRSVPTRAIDVVFWRSLPGTQAKIITSLL